MANTLFLLGAGFNKDAKNEAGKIIGHSIYKGDYEIECGYPLIDELYRICFHDTKRNPTISIEDLFADAIKKREFKPLQRLYNTIMEADYYIINKLLYDKPDTNCYSKFFKEFQEASFLTFNYDSLPEIFLLKLNRWFPHDGYGVPVETELVWSAVNKYTKQNSKSFILHLHGSLCIYVHNIEFSTQSNGNVATIKLKEKPEFIFDPDSITDLFHPYSRVYPKIGSYEPTEMRVIAPVPDKTEGLKNSFTMQIYLEAKKLLSASEVLIVIGYNFSAHDRSSYQPLIDYISTNWSGKIVIVSPNAEDIEKRLRSEYPSIKWVSVNATFKEWVDTGYNGMN
jgi:hypothetical protein